jgi:hypothetical protein
MADVGAGRVSENPSNMQLMLQQATASSLFQALVLQHSCARVTGWMPPGTSHGLVMATGCVVTIVANRQQPQTKSMRSSLILQPPLPPPLHAVQTYSSSSWLPTTTWTSRDPLTAAVVSDLAGPGAFLYCSHTFTHQVRPHGGMGGVGVCLHIKRAARSTAPQDDLACVL